MMGTILKWTGIVLAALVILVALFLTSMRFHDGPNAIFTGGPFRSGELTGAPDDWSFLAGRMEIEFQTMDPDTSRVVWLGVLNKRLYILSGYMNTTYGKIWKQWPYYLEDDDRIILRIDGKLYEQRLQRLMEHPELVELLTLYANKYGGGLTGEITQEAASASLAAGDFWMFEVVDR